MALALDGFHVLRVIGKNEDIFASVPAIKAANALFAEQLKKTDIKNLREIYRAIGSEDFGKMVDVLAKLAPILKCVDGFKATKVMSIDDQRKHLKLLARGEIEPLPDLISAQRQQEKIRKLKEKEEKKALAERTNAEKAEAKARKDAEKKMKNPQKKNTGSAIKVSGSGKQREKTEESAPVIFGRRSMKPRER